MRAWKFPDGRALRRMAAWVGLTSVLFYASAWVSIHFTVPGTWMSIVWPPNGIAVAIGILVGPWVALGVLLGDFVFESQAMGSPVLATGSAIGNMIQVFAIAWFVRRYLGGRDAFTEPKRVVAYAVVAGFILTTISACIGVTALAYYGSLPVDDYWLAWTIWWLADSVAVLLIPPLVLVWVRQAEARDWNGKELTGLALATAVVFVLIGWGHVGGMDHGYAILVMPLSAWAAFRFGDRAVVLVSLTLAVATLIHLSTDASTVSTGHEVALHFQAQVVIAVSSTVGLVVAAYVEQERRRFKAAAQKEFDAVNAARNRLLSTFAHELNNPLTPMRLQLDFLLAGHPGPLNEKQSRSVAMIQRNTMRLSKLVSDLRDVSHLQSGQGLRLRAAPINLAAIAREATETYRLPATAAGLEIEVDAPPSALSSGDPDRLVQVVDNLVSNALKYSPRGGRVRVRVAPQGSDHVISVQDSGTGLTESQVMELFQPFSQVLPQDRQKAGTGLGLYIARGIVEGHGGTIWCESGGSGKGAVFSVRLPGRAAPPPVQVAIPAALREVTPS